MRRASFQAQLPRVIAWWIRPLRRLARDQRGNVLFIVAAAFIPMLAIVGGAMDMGRGYMARTRLQQACDAGVLAARKKMGSTAIVGKVVPDTAAAVGRTFFKQNFQDMAYGTKVAPTFTMSMASDYSIAGAASVPVPTTLMYLFGVETLPVSVDCSSQFNYSNTDIMMVLDVTGSMSGTLGAETRIAALRRVVKTFYQTVEDSKKTGIRVRYGFVPYSTTVNVGYLLQSRWMTDEGSYEGRSPNASGTAWVYKTTPISLTEWKSGISTNPYKGGESNAKKMGGNYWYATDIPIEFEGCIEERATYPITDYKNVDLTRARDLDLDAVPDPGNPDTQWKPWVRATGWWNRNSTGQVVSTGTYTRASGDGLACAAPARKLAPMTATEVSNYVDSLVPGGFTYHDIGMIWGGRLISPTGLFAGDNADVDGRPTMRHLIFLTDGETNAEPSAYGAYGIEPSSRRRCTDCTDSKLTAAVESRFTYACNAVKNKNVTVWVIGFSSDVSMTKMFTDCAGAGHWFKATNASELSDAFATIASAIGDLRIIK